MSLEYLRISEKILSGTAVEVESEVFQTGEVIMIYFFSSSCPDSAMASTRVQFGDDILWVMQRDSKVNLNMRVHGDGIKKIKVICENSCSSDYYFNSFVEYAVIYE